MRNRFLSGALACALLSGGAAAAFAVPASETTLDFQVKPGATKAGTKKTPKNATVMLAIKGGIEEGAEGQPATSKGLNISLPATWKINSERWPKKARCDIAEVNRDKDTSSCPKGSQVGKGQTIAQGANGAITRTLIVTAFVIENGDLGFFIKNKAGESPAINEMIQGVVKGSKINVKIPTTIQEPIEGVPTGIQLLEFKLSATAKIKGKKTAIVQTTGCKKGKWKFGLTNVYRDGKKSDSDTVKCKA